jgi:hypothetical protein
MQLLHEGEGRTSQKVSHERITSAIPAVLDAA